MEFLALLPRIINYLACRHEDLSHRVELPVKFFFGYPHRSLELLIPVNFTWVIPTFVESRYARCKARVNTIPFITRHIDPIIHCIHFKEVIPIELLVYLFEVIIIVSGKCFRLSDAHHLAEDFASKVPPDKTCRAELDLGGLIGIDGQILLVCPTHVKRTLMVVEAVLGDIKHSSHIANYI
jgi:hypothetical protein